MYPEKQKNAGGESQLSFLAFFICFVHENSAYVFVSWHFAWKA